MNYMSLFGPSAGAIPALSVCIIGRNEGRHLRACADSLARLSEAGVSYESIFVDSASSDDSVSIAASSFDCVIELAASPNLNAGAARHVATSAARAAWILYLDADMELLPDLVDAIGALLAGSDHRAGLCGYTVNRYSDGSGDRIRYSGNHDGQCCHSFGGAVLLPRQAVLDAGNWSTCLFAYEEAELYSRLADTVRVIWHERDFVLHKTPKVANRRKLTGLISPRGSYLGKKYYGAGQVTRLTLANGNFWRFARIKPWGYVLLAALLLSLAGLALSPWGALPLLLAVLLLVTRKGIKSLFVHACWLPQIAFGCGKLAPGFMPVVSAFTDAAIRHERGARRAAPASSSLPPSCVPMKKDPV